MRKRFLGLILCLTILCAGLPGCAEFFFNPAIRIGEDEISTQELEKALLMAEMESCLHCASYGYAYELMDRLSILDAMSKVLFDLEMRHVVQAQADDLGLALTDAELEELAFLADSQFASYLAIVNSENGLAYLPAWKYDYVEDDPDNAIRYLNAFSLNRETIYQQLCQDALEQKLLESVTASMENASDDDRIDHYTNWILEKYDQIEIDEDPLAIAEVCMAMQDPD